VNILTKIFHARTTKSHIINAVTICTVESPSLQQIKH